MIEQPARGAEPGSVIEILPWDSAFFGLRIARVTDMVPTPETLQLAVRLAAREGVRCLYLAVAGDAVVKATPPALGFQLVEVQITLRRALQPLERKGPGQVRVRTGTLEDLSQLNGVLEQLVPWSRFAADPRFGINAARAMYAAWIRRSAESADELFGVAEDEGELVGFVTCEMRSTPTIGLLASAKHRTGVGRALVEKAVTWAGERGDVLEVTTQARNVAALRFYENLGFRAERVRYVYHLWLGEVYGE